MNWKLRRMLPALPLAIVAFGLAAGAKPRSESPNEDARESALKLQETFAAIAERAGKSVVSVTSYVREESTASEQASPEAGSSQWQEARETDLYPGFRKLHSGSGVVLGKETHIVTLRRFVTRSTGEPADVVDVETQDGQHVMCRVVGVEPTLDLAVLEFVPLSEGYRPKLVSAAPGDSDSLRVGYWTFALGDPSGPAQAFIPGFLSAKPERSCYQEQLTATYMQAALNVHPEAYGGPLVNIRGEVVGITTPRPSQQADGHGIEYALPINVVMPIYEGLKVNQSFRSPWLGFAVLEMAALRDRSDAEAFQTMLRPHFGIYIDAVFEPSPASKADIRIGDFLIGFNGKRIFSVYRFQEQLHLTGIGRPAKLEFFRAGQTFLKDIVVEERPKAAAPQ